MADAEGDTKRSQLELSPQAAGEIRADFKRGFIRAETIAYEDYFSLGGESGAREAGKLRQKARNTWCRTATSCCSSSTSDHGHQSSSRPLR